MSERFQVNPPSEPLAQIPWPRHQQGVGDAPLPAPRSWRATSYWGDAARRLRRNRTALAGGSIFVLVVVGAVFANWISRYDPIQADFTAIHQAPSLRHLFGTDELGRDVLTRVLYGGRISLWVGLVSVGISASAGLLFGLLAGYYGGWVDGVLMRVADIMLAFPGIMLALGMVAILGPSITNLMIAVGISYIPHYTRVVRASVIAAKVFPYVEAARVVGCRNRRIMFVHILPNAVTPVIVIGTLGMGVAILIAAGLSFLGLGVPPPTPEWGSMVSLGRTYLREYWWIATFPGLATMVTVMAINLLGDGVRDALDPRWRRR